MCMRGIYKTVREAQRLNILERKARQSDILERERDDRIARSRRAQTCERSAR